MKTHVIKCDPAPFEAVQRGLKRHEVRVNDRDYKTGDHVVMEEFDRQTKTYSGRSIEAVIEWLTPGGSYGLPVDLCVFTIHKIAFCFDQERAGAEEIKGGGA